MKFLKSAISAYLICILYCDSSLIEQEVIYLHVLCLGFLFTIIWPCPTYGTISNLELNPAQLEADEFEPMGLLGPYAVF